MPLDLVALKKSFFDTKAVTDALDPEVRKALLRVAGTTRKIARNSIKRRKGKSKPGQPPFAHQGDIKRILFGYDTSSKSAVIGPIIYGSQSGAPETLEEGGYARLKSGRTVKVAARPTMKPAFKKGLDTVGNNFRNLIG